MTTKPLPSLLYSLLLAAAGAVLAMGLAPAAAEPVSAAYKAAGDETRWILLQTAPQATFDGQRLTLHKVNPMSVMFTDRPKRIAESVPTAGLLKLWSGKETFQQSPPNAGVTVVDGDKLATAVVELTEPQLTDGNLSYKVRLIEGGLPQSAGSASVFIDDFCASCASDGF